MDWDDETTSIDTHALTPYNSNTQDQAVTFLLVNGACSLSDRFGRKPFMAMANMGLGTGQVIASFAKDPRLLLIGKCWPSVRVSVHACARTEIPSRIA